MTSDRKNYFRMIRVPVQPTLKGINIAFILIFASQTWKIWWAFNGSSDKTDFSFLTNTDFIFRREFSGIIKSFRNTLKNYSGVWLIAFEDFQDLFEIWNFSLFFFFLMKKVTFCSWYRYIPLRRNLNRRIIKLAKLV